ncbi:protein AMBP-like, partial [Polyodon spathula]|uniref:protein AMBP-like n=1 Tax=Polyodon spathula TaxID=7913 RepID=UPI001B7DFD38
HVRADAFTKSLLCECTVIRDTGYKALPLSVCYSRNGQCKEKTAVYRETETPGHMKYHCSRWNADVDVYVVRTNYDEYAMVLMLKQKEGEVTKTAKLYGRSQELRPSLHEDFKQFALEQGIGEESIQMLPKTEECQPRERDEPAMLKVRRDVGLAQAPEGSGDDTPFFHKEDSCKLPRDQGPCFGYEPRFFYNATLMTCQEFSYGGCLGNDNNFVTEKECLQSCRTEAVCRL